MFCITSETEGAVGVVDMFHNYILKATIIHYSPFQCGSSVVVHCCLFKESVSVTLHLMFVHIILV